MSTDRNPYAPPQAPVIDVRDVPRPPRGLLLLWLCAGYCFLASVLGLLGIAILSLGMLPLSLELTFYWGLALRFVLLFATGVALLRREGIAAELLVVVLIIRGQVRALQLGHTFDASVLEIPDWIIQGVVMGYAFVLRGRGVLRPAPALPAAHSLGGLYCLIPGLLYLVLSMPGQLQAVGSGAEAGPSFLLALIPALLRILAGLQILRGSCRAPQTLAVLCGLSLLRAAIPALWPTDLPVPGFLLPADLTVLAAITLHAFVQRRRAVPT